MSNGWLTILTWLDLAGLIPFLFNAAKSSGWLPQHQTPTFLPRIFVMDVMPESFHVSSVIPDRGKAWGTEATFPAFSRLAKRLGSQSRPNCACPPSTTVSGVISGP